MNWSVPMDDNEPPEGWMKCKLEKVLNRSNEKWSPEDGGEHRYLSLKHIEKDTGRILGHGSSSEVDSSKTVFSEGDVLYGKLRPYLNKVARPSFDGVCSTDILVFSSSPLIDNNFLKHRLRATDLVKYADQNSSGINLPRISPSDLGEFEIGLPPLPEQRRIADRLDAIQSRTQATGDTLDQVPDRIEEYRQSVLNAAFTGRLTADWREDHPDLEAAEELLERILVERRSRWEKQYRWERYDSEGKEPPSGWKDRYDSPKQPAEEALEQELPDSWEWVSLDTVTWNDVDYRGKTPPYSDDGIPTISAGNVKGGQVTFKDRKKFVSKETYEEWLTRGEPEPGDLIITTEAPVGETALLPGDETYLLTRRVLACQTVFFVNEFLKYCFNAGATRRHLDLNSRGTTVPRILKKVLFKTPIPLPPLEEQEEVVRRINQRLDKIDQMSRHVGQAGERLEHLDRSVLARAFRGELVETEAERARQADRDYETAEELLERVRGESSSEDQSTSSEEQASTITQVDENGQFEMKVVEDDPDL